jgi:hypothetical protein
VAFLSILTYPFRFLWWIACFITRKTLGKEEDPWILTAFIFIGGAVSFTIFRWCFAFGIFIFGTKIWYGPLGICFSVFFFIPFIISLLRLLQITNPEPFNLYWNQPPPSLALDLNLGGKRAVGPPRFYFGDFEVLESALFLGIICTGGIGSGKTATFVYPFMDTLFREYNTRKGRANIGGLMLDVKGEFADSVMTLMKRHGRNPEEDLIVINPDDAYSYRYNPVVPHLTHIQVAGRFRSILSNLGGGGGDSFWLDSAEKVVANAILLCRQAYGSPATELAKVGRIIADDSYLKSTMEKVKTSLAGQKRPSELAPRLEKEIFEDRNKNISFVVRYFEKEWIPMAEQTKSGIVAAVSNQLLRGFTDPKLQRLFCTDTNFSMFDTVGYTEMDEVDQNGKILNPGKDIEGGKIVILQAPGWGMTALMIGAALKLDFQQCMKDRVLHPVQVKDRLKKKKIDTDRRVFFICDEYQDYVTCGGKNEGDETFYAVSRQSRIINAVATQSYNSIYAKVKDDNAVQVLLQNLRVKICLNGEDSKTAKHVSDLCGKVERERQSGFSKNDKASIFTSAKSKSYSIEKGEMFAEYEFFRLVTKVGKSQDSSYSEGIIYNGGFTDENKICAKIKLKPLWISSGDKNAAKEYWMENRKVRRDMDAVEALEYQAILKKHGKTAPVKPDANKGPAKPEETTNEPTGNKKPTKKSDEPAPQIKTTGLPPKPTPEITETDDGSDMEDMESNENEDSDTDNDDEKSDTDEVPDPNEPYGIPEIDETESKNTEDSEDSSETTETPPNGKENANINNVVNQAEQLTEVDTAQMNQNLNDFGLFGFDLIPLEPDIREPITNTDTPVTESIIKYEQTHNEEFEKEKQVQIEAVKNTETYEPQTPQFDDEITTDPTEELETLEPLDSLGDNYTNNTITTGISPTNEVVEPIEKIETTETVTAKVETEKTELEITQTEPQPNQPIEPQTTNQQETTIPTIEEPLHVKPLGDLPNFSLESNTDKEFYGDIFSDEIPNNLPPKPTVDKPVTPKPKKKFVSD